MTEDVASLMAAACRIGAQLSGSSNEHAELPGQHAEALRISFQLADDGVGHGLAAQLGMTAGARAR